MKKLLTVLAVSGVLLLTGCASGAVDTKTNEPSTLYETEITLSDGRTVTCITYKDGYAGGTSCDWDRAK